MKPVLRSVVVLAVSALALGLPACASSGGSQADTGDGQDVKAGEACGDDVAIRKKCPKGLTCVLPTSGPISEHTPGMCKAATNIPSTQDSKLSRLPDLWAVTPIPNSDGLDIRLYQVGVDPDASAEPNGAHLWLGITTSNKQHAIFDLQVGDSQAGVREVLSAKWTGTGSLEIRGSADSPSRSFTSTVRYRLDSTLAELSVDGKSVAASTLAQDVFLGGTDRITQNDLTERGTSAQSNHIARVYSVRRDTMRGAHLFLTLGAPPHSRTYDLGLDVATVANVSYVSASEVRIDGNDIGVGGAAEPKAFTYSVKFTFDQSAGASRGMPSPTVDLARH